MADEITRSAELAHAEEWARNAVNGTVPSHLVTLLAEYDRRGADLAMMRSELTTGRLRDRIEVCEWEEYADALTAENEKLRGTPPTFGWLTGAVSDETAAVVADVKSEAVWLVLHMQANGTREDIQSALRTLRLAWGDPPPVTGVKP